MARMIQTSLGREFPSGNSMSKLKSVSIIVLALATVLAVYATMFKRIAAPEVTFVSLKGERITMGDLRGKVVLVEFWATDCATCVKEMPQVVATYHKYRDRGFETIAVAMKYDPPNYVVSYAEKNALPFKVALDPMGELAQAFGDVKLTPTTFVIDKRGNIVSRMVGERDFAKLHRLLEEKLADPV
jgi:peroxiredoxin